MSKQINLVINGKGGVGKSFFATNFVQYLKDRCLVHRALDTDHENSTLTRFHPEAGFVNLEDKRGLNEIFTAAETNDLLVIDCRAASTDLFLDYFSEVVLSEVLVVLDARLTVICPVNHEADSVEQVRVLSEALGLRCRYVVVKNQAHSDSFQLYEGSKTRGYLRDALGAREMTMPRLYDWLVTALNKHNVTVTETFKHPAFHFLDRQQLRHWQNKFYEEVDAVAGMLLPVASTSTPVKTVHTEV
jgi:CobQ/CobB/MinD/ParA nucleotide binding domain